MEDIEQDRIEAVSASLEAQFHICRKETDLYLSEVRTDHEGVFPYSRIDDFLKFVRMNAQLAGVIARLEKSKNRNSKTQ
jgi:hypothetical protein